MSNYVPGMVDMKQVLKAIRTNTIKSREESGCVLIKRPVLLKRSCQGVERMTDWCFLVFDSAWLFNPTMSKAEKKNMRFKILLSSNEEGESFATVVRDSFGKFILEQRKASFKHCPAGIVIEQDHENKQGSKDMWKAYQKLQNGSKTTTNGGKITLRVQLNPLNDTNITMEAFEKKRQDFKFPTSQLYIFAGILCSHLHSGNPSPGFLKQHIRWIKFLNNFIPETSHTQVPPKLGQGYRSGPTNEEALHIEMGDLFTEEQASHLNALLTAEKVSGILSLDSLSNKKRLAFSRSKQMQWNANKQVYWGHENTNYGLELRYTPEDFTIPCSSKSLKMLYKLCKSERPAQVQLLPPAMTLNLESNLEPSNPTPLSLQLPPPLPPQPLQSLYLPPPLPLQSLYLPPPQPLNPHTGFQNCITQPTNNPDYSTLLELPLPTTSPTLSPTPTHSILSNPIALSDDIFSFHESNTQSDTQETLSFDDLTTNGLYSDLYSEDTDAHQSKRARMSPTHALFNTLND